MRIDKISITNFRQYQQVDFEFNKTQDTDIHIILGRNGVGKTNILNAITWCLYGEELHLGDKDNANTIFNNTAAKEHREQGVKYGDVKVSITFTSEESRKTIVVNRTAQYSFNSTVPMELSNKQTIRHTVNGQWQIEEDEETTTSMIMSFVPKAINEYIFFDGEHLEQYFQAGQLDKIKKAINDFTQANLLENAIKSFSQFDANVIGPKFRGSGDELVARYEADLEVNLQQQKVHLDKIDVYNNQVAICDKEITDCNSIIAGNDTVPEKSKRLLTLDEIIEDKNKELKSKLREMYKFTREYYVYLSLFPAMSKYYKYIKKQESEGKLPPKLDKDFLTEVLHKGTCPICDNILSKHAEENINRLLTLLDVSTKTSAELNKTMSALSGYFDLIKKYPSLKEKYIAEIQRVEKDIKIAEEEQKRLAEYLKSIPDNESIAKALEKRKEFTESKEKHLGLIGEETGYVKGYQQTEKMIREQLNSALEKNKKLDGIRKQREFCRECIRVLTETRSEVLEECRQEMVAETYDIYSNLLWKKDAFERVEIDENYNFKLFDSFGNQTLGSCSAAERALLALSFTLALQKTSKHDSLLFIDTPIGRVDEENRGNMIQTLLEISKGKQVILTFTPTEYDKDVQMQLAGKYSSFNELKMVNHNTSKKD